MTNARTGVSPPASASTSHHGVSVVDGGKAERWGQCLPCLLYFRKEAPFAFFKFPPLSHSGGRESTETSGRTPCDRVE